jgi:hypothetical protein
MRKRNLVKTKQAAGDSLAPAACFKLLWLFLFQYHAVIIIIAFENQFDL